MASEKQIAANRLNSQKSTGPRTETGKQASRMNALKSGIHAQSHVIRGEDPEALAQLAAEYNAEFHPTTPRQRDLVDALVHNEWHIRRLRAIEVDLWAAEFDEKDHFTVDPRNHYDVRRRQFPLRTAYEGQQNRLERLQRSLHAYERSAARALKQLRELQSGVGVPACPPAEGRQPAQEASTSSEIGFVPSNPPHPLIPDPRPLIPAERSEAALPPPLLP
jgi:hypothetical protein